MLQFDTQRSSTQVDDQELSSPLVRFNLKKQVSAINDDDAPALEAQPYSEQDSDIISQDIKQLLRVKKPPPEFVPYKSRYRWLMLLFLWLSICLQSAISCCLTPIGYIIKDAYQVTLLEVDFCAIIFTLTYVIFTLLVMPLYNSFPIQWVIRLGCAVMVTGAWIRMFTFTNNIFWPVLFGTAVLSCAYPVFLGGVSLIIQSWFPDDERAVVTMICGIAIPFGNILSLVMVGSDFVGVQMGQSTEAIQSLRILFLQQNVIITIVCTGFGIFV